jgi:2',3'-cyclic-nucleotide 2'-phosphodiesterase (5'-nucleotidase family)
MLTDQGDVRGWTALSTAFNGAVDIDVMNRLGYDAMVPGNHEFEWPKADFLRNVQESHFPWVCANLIYKDSGKYVTVPYVIRDVWGARVAIFGLTNDWPIKQPEYYKGAPELGVFIQPPAEVAASIVPELRQKADIVILLSHLGYREDVKLAQTVPGIDLILGGHSHSAILTPTMVKVRERTAFDMGVVPVEQAWYNGVYLGKTRTIFRRDPASGRYTLMSCRGELIKIDSSIPDDPEVSGVIREWESVRQANVEKAQ